MIRMPVGNTFKGHDELHLRSLCDGMRVQLRPNSAERTSLR
jgi:hypothetical protein